MRSVFTAITRFSLRFRTLTLVLAGLVMVAGGIAASQLNQELLPPVEFPQTIVLTQVSGLTSEEVLTFLTERLEAELAGVENVVNIESTTTGAFGSILTLSNDFGINRVKLQRDIQAALERVWLPLRRLEAPEGVDSADFTATLLADVQPELLIYLNSRDDSFLFQLTPEVWAGFSDDTLRTVATWLALEVQQDDATKSALTSLVEQEIIPQLSALESIASIQVSGGQAIPGEEVFSQASTQSGTRSLLYQLSPDTWRVISTRLGLGALDEQAVTALSSSDSAGSIPEIVGIPALPESWQAHGFKDASDLLEVRTLTTNAAGIWNRFAETGRIVGALGQTDDLTPEILQQLLEVAPNLIAYLEADQLQVLAPEIFALLPADYIAGLDGFTRDALAAKALAAQITGDDTPAQPVRLPSQWRVAPPQTLTFSFGDLPLATFSVYAPAEASAAVENGNSETQPEPVVDAQPEQPSEPVAAQPVEIPEGPSLPITFNLLGGGLGIELNTADDLINLTLPENLAAQFGSSTLRAADLLNFLVLLANPDQLPEGAPSIPVNPSVLLGGFSADAFEFVAANDPTFIPNLSAGVYAYFSDAVLQSASARPPLADVWSALSEQPQFAASPLTSAADLIRIGDGSASSVLNTINLNVPEAFAGYEVRLFDSLDIATLRYFAANEPGFYAALDADVLSKLSAEALTALPEGTLEGRDAELVDSLTAIADGTQPSAFDLLRERYAVNVPPADPNAPVLNADWDFIADFVGVELNSADDFFRFFPNPAGFLNSFFDTAQGANFAPNLYGNMPPEVMAYIAQRDPAVIAGLSLEVLQLLTPETLAVLPAEAQARAAGGGDVFVPTETITRNNGASSLLVTIFKENDANTVSTYYETKAIIEKIQQDNPGILVTVAFEQSSFVEESISGVAREGLTGALFAMVIILIFLSGGRWNRSPRRTVGMLMLVAFTGALMLILFAAANSGGISLQQAFEQTDIVLKVLLILGALAGLGVLLWPGDLPYPAWRATLVIGVSIPLSVFAAFALMRWLPGAVNGWLAPIAGDSPVIAFILRLFPEGLTLNIMTLSGLTVAVGRIVDDSIVVLENSFRYIQQGGDRRQAILTGTRDVSSAIFVATLITVVVFLPLGLTGGLIGEFFLPFGLAVTYALLSSYVVAITVVPVLMTMFIRASDAAEEDHRSGFDRLYDPILKWALRNSATKSVVLLFAVASMVLGFGLFAARPAAFLPEFGELQIEVSADLPQGTKILDTNVLAQQFEDLVRERVPEEELKSLRTIVGGGGLNLDSLFGGGSVAENRANIVITAELPADQLEELAQEIRIDAESVFGADNVEVAVASLASGGGFGGFELVVSGPQDVIEAYDAQIIAAIEGVEGIEKVTSDLTDGLVSGPNAPRSYVRVNSEPAISYSGELTTENTIGVTQQAIEAVQAIADLPETLTVSQGFQSELQTSGFASLFVAMGIALAIVVVILVLGLGSPVYWLAIILSVVVAPVGAAIALTLTGRVLGISALIGMLMLIGIVITNAVVLIDRVRQNIRESGMSTYDALVEAGERRLRPILMTALATIIALSPLAVGLSEGALIASELGTVVIGGLVSSTLLTLLVVPVAFSLLTPLHRLLTGDRSKK